MLINFALDNNHSISDGMLIFFLKVSIGRSVAALRKDVTVLGPDNNHSMDALLSHSADVSSEADWDRLSRLCPDGWQS